MYGNVAQGNVMNPLMNGDAASLDRPWAPHELQGDFFGVYLTTVHFGALNLIRGVNEAAFNFPSIFCS